MRPFIRRALARLATAAVLATAGIGAAQSGALASGYVWECKVSSGISCISFSGYSGRSTWGFPVNSSGNNCTNYAAYRIARNGVVNRGNLGNGGDWAARARSQGFPVDRTPHIGAVAQWDYGSSYAPSMGHVGYVEEVTSSYITISDSSWSGGSGRWRIPYGDAAYPNNFIHFKDVGYQPPPSGSFVQTREDNLVYQLVGEAPVHVSTWAGFHRTYPTHLLSRTSLAQLPQRPAEGTMLRGNVGGELYRVTGGAPVVFTTWAAVGGWRPYTAVDQAALDQAGTGGTNGRFDHLRAQPADNTVLRVAADGRTYVVRGGIAYRFTSYTQIGGYRAPAPVDSYAIAYAGQPLRWSHLRGSGTLP